MNYSGLSILRNALSGHRKWPRAWANREPRKHYDVLIIGAGGHGLATAYYLARHQGIRSVAVLEKGYLGGGNTGRNTMVSRSNYFYPESGAFYEHSLHLFENLAGEVNFNVMFSQRGILAICHSRHEMEMYRRWANAIQMNDTDSEVLGREVRLDRQPALDGQGAHVVEVGPLVRRLEDGQHAHVHGDAERGELPAHVAHRAQ